MNPNDSNRSGARALWILAVAFLAVLLIALLVPRPEPGSADHTFSGTAASGDTGQSSNSGSSRPRLRSSSGSQAKTAEAIVARKVRQFGRKRHDLVREIARRSKKEVPPEVEKFFDAVERGNWEEINSRWQELAHRSGQYDYSEHSEELDPYWAAVLDAYGVAEQAHEWPAQQLLDYGNAILDSLRPGMVYVGGTDNGRWVPTLLTETSGDEPHVVVTQNALADARYLEFVNELYGGRLSTLTQEDSQRAFQEYVADAQKRLAHDREHPDEPKQVRPGENILDADGKVQVSGAVAVMAVNERLLQMLMEKNPGLSFAMEESQPLPGLYANSIPRGPLMELQIPDAHTRFTADVAAQSVDYWRNVAQNVLGDPAATASQYALRAYSHDIDSAGNLLAAHNYTAEAEQAYRLSSQLWPANPESTARLAALLARTGRADQSRQLLNEFSRKYPDALAALDKISGSITFQYSSP